MNESEPNRVVAWRLQRQRQASEMPRSAAVPIGARNPICQHNWRLPLDATNDRTAEYDRRRAP